MRILVVEDDPQIAGFLSKGLREERHAVDMATDGEEALALTRTQPYDLIILDLMIPKLDGLAVCQRIRRARYAVPILMLTARESLDDKVLGLDAGADDYLTKPFAYAELLARVRALLRRRSDLPSHPLRIADLELDPIARTVTRAATPISLTNKEYGVLEYLLRNAGRVLTRTAIIEHVWDIHFDTMTNIVDVNIRSLRSKIDRGFAPPLIHTVRGVGYVLKVSED